MEPPPVGQRLPCPHCGQSILVPADFTATASGHDDDSDIMDVQGPHPPQSTDTGAGGPLSAADFKDYLAPSQGPGELGRLGPYRILRVLGAGGMGVVFEAEDTKLQRPVALKVMKPELAHREASRQRFLREARAAASLEHPHVVTIYQVDEDRGVPYLAMPLLKGETLASRLRRDSKLPVGELLRIGKQIASGLAAAHERGLIHRDIKPDNIFLVPDEAHTSGTLIMPGSSVKIVDFGLARPVGSNVNLTRAGAVLGTPAFMAPEQARGEEIDPRADLFSLGCVLYRAATGVMPFPGNDPLTLFAALANHEPRAPLSLNGDLPPGFSELIQRLLAKKRERRPESARAVMLEIDRMERAYLGTLAGTFGLTQETLPAPRPRRRWLFALAMTAVVAAVVGILEWNLRHQDEPAPGESSTVDEAEAVPGTDKQDKQAKVQPEPKAQPKSMPLPPVRPGLDGLEAKRIPAVYHFDGQPAELVGVFQEERLGEISAVAFSPRGRCLATGGPDGVGLWEFDPWPRQWATIPMRHVNYLAYTADGALLAVGTRTGDLKFWGNVGDQRVVNASGEAEPILEMTYRDRAETVALSPDGRMFAVATGKQTRCFHIIANRRYEERQPAFPTGEVIGLAFSGDGSILACAVPRLGVNFYDLAPGGPRRIRFPELRFHTRALAFAPQYSLLAAASGEAGTVRLYEFGNVQPTMLVQLDTPDLKARPAALAFSPDGRRLALKFAEGKLILWDDVARLRKLIDGRKELKVPETSTALAFTSDGRYLATAGRKGLIYIFRLP
ncbi:MAG: WD40 repeat domain-containing serine/threonine protein kinase [Gemmataceae bacterium]